VIDEHHLVLERLVDGAARAARHAKQRHRVVALHLVERALLGLERRRRAACPRAGLLVDSVEIVGLLVGVQKSGSALAASAAAARFFFCTRRTSQTSAAMRSASTSRTTITMSAM
jgi:hypothetical protein